MKKTGKFLIVSLLSMVCLLAGCSSGSGSNDSPENNGTPTNSGEVVQQPSLREEVSGKIGKYGKPYKVGDRRVFKQPESF